jgi:hypothetical protein
MQVDAEVPCFTPTLAKPVTGGVAHLRFLYGGIFSANADISRAVRAALGSVPQSDSGDSMLHS